MQNFKFGLTMASLILCLLVFALVVKVIGFKRSLYKLRYFITFHWLLDIIIQWREGTTPASILNQEFKDLIENDVEFVDIVIKQQDQEIRNKNIKTGNGEVQLDPVLNPQKIAQSVDQNKDQTTAELEQIRQLKFCLENDTYVDFKSMG